MEQLLWRIYYSDKTTFSNLDGGPKDAPSEGFICAVGYTPSGDRYIMHGWDFYQWDIESQQWWGMNLAGLFDRLRRNLVYAYKEGRTLTNGEYQKIMDQAHNDPDFPIGGR